jgi:hypothetical protein
MTAEVNTKPYRIRLLERVAFYDDRQTHMFIDWPAGTIISDQAAIEMIETRGWSVEKIETVP